MNLTPNQNLELSVAVLRIIKTLTPTQKITIFYDTERNALRIEKHGEHVTEYMGTEIKIQS